ncbi:MFS transporter [Pseudomonas sp. LRF_L74]|uniref:MFS transporter n=1 Tax=Pseudomonas sp. LRF_L74 TaxID=3369422 RepID=UPI003F63F3C8
MSSETVPATRHATLVSLLVAVTFFMENLDATVIATALPQMAESFGVAPVDLNIGISAYLLAVAIFIPLSGWLADRFGARLVFANAIGLFTLASVLCAISPDLETFVASRVLQGIGGALMVPVGRLAVLRLTEKKDLVKMIAVITWPGLVAPVLGPPVGGFIVTHTSWPWIFYLNVPLGLIALAFALKLIPVQRLGEAVRSFDGLGFLLVAGACAAIILGMEWIGGGSATLAAGFGLGAVGVVLAFLAIRHSRRHASPLLPLDAVSLQTFRVSLVGGSLFRAAISALPFLLPLLFQLGFGLSPVTAGLLVLWVFAGNLLMKPFTTAVMRRWGFRRVLLVNGIITVLAILACAILDAGMAWPWVALILFIGGLSRSMQFTCYNSIGFADVPKQHMSSASTLFSMFFQLSMSLGIAAGALLLRLAQTLHGNQGSATTADFQLAFIGVAVIAVLALIDILRLPADAGSGVLEKR